MTRMITTVDYERKEGEEPSQSPAYNMPLDALECAPKKQSPILVLAYRSVCLPKGTGDRLKYIVPRPRVL